jgi:hypothetical protein
MANAAQQTLPPTSAGRVSLHVRDYERRTFNLQQRRVPRAFAEAIFFDEGAPFEPGQLDALVADCDDFVSRASNTLRFGLVGILFALRWLPIVMIHRLSTFEALDIDDRVAMLERMDRGNPPLPLMVVAYKTILAMLFFEAPRALAAIGYHGPERERWKRVLGGRSGEAGAAHRPAFVMSDDGIVHGRTVEAPVRASVDVVIVGSGASGAVVASHLAREGLSAVVLEEGGHYTPEEYGALTPSQSIRRIAREAGLCTAVGVGDTPLIAVMAGKCVGGSSVLTGGVCFRIPEEVLHGWSRDLGLTGMTADALAPFFEDVEARVQVETVPLSMRSRGTELFVEGAAKLGIPMRSLRRNTHSCKGAARCNFGCPNRAKMSVDISYLPDAFAHGARLYSDALVETIDIAGGGRSRRARKVPRRRNRRAARRVRVPRQARRRRVRIAPHAGLASKERPRPPRHRAPPDAAPGVSCRRAVRRRGGRVGRRASERLLRPLPRE